jgi:transposase
VFLEGAGARRDSLRKSFSPSSAERSSLETPRRSSRDARMARLAQPLLWRAQGYSVAQIAQLSGVSAQTIYNWMARFQQGDTTLADRPRSGRPPVLGRHRAWLEEQLHQDPQVWGYHQATWTVPLLRHHLWAERGAAVSERRLQRGLHALGYRWKRPRYLLAQRDPLRQRGRGLSSGSSVMSQGGSSAVRE